MKGPFVITISREVGSGGRTIGRKLAEKLGIRFSDKYAHASRNAADGLIPGTQFRERALDTQVGVNRKEGGVRGLMHH